MSDEPVNEVTEQLQPPTPDDAPAIEVVDVQAPVEENVPQDQPEPVVAPADSGVPVGGDVPEASADEPVTPVSDSPADAPAEPPQVPVAVPGQVVQLDELPVGVLGVVNPGDRDADNGLVSHLMRWLGAGDAQTYHEGAVVKVKQLQEEAGLEPDGIVTGPVWALVLPEVDLDEIKTIPWYLLHVLRLRRSYVTLENLQTVLAERLEELGFNPSTLVRRDHWEALLADSANYEVEYEVAPEDSDVFP